MNLFSKDKELIFKITNAILLLWLIGSLIFVCSSVIELVVKEPTYTYVEYKNNSCDFYTEDESLTTADIEENCNNDYNIYKDSLDDNDYYKWISLYTAIANVLIVGGVIFFINKKEAKTYKKK